MWLSVLLTFALQQVVGSTVAWIVRETLAMVCSDCILQQRFNLTDFYSSSL